jgi:hypothetical protein
MAVLKINGPQTSTKPVIDFAAELETIVLRFQVAWNSRFEHWNLRVATAEGEEVLAGVRVVADTDMFEAYTDPRLPPGKLICRDPTNEGKDPGRNDFQNRHFFAYIEFVEPTPPPLSILPPVPV